MKKILFSLMCAILLPLGMMAQTVTLTFTGKDANTNRVQLDHVAITNLTKGWQETLYWPDTTLTMQNGTGIDDVETQNIASLQLSQNNPNPFNGTTDVLLTVPDAGMVVLEIADANGRIVGTHRVRPQLGAHLFRVTLSAAGTYVMTARQNGKTSSIKMVNNGGGNGDGIEYAGVVEAQNFAPLQPKSGTRGNTANPFNFGDMMEYVGYATINGVEYESERISQMQGASQTFALMFDLYASGLPMVSTLSVSNLTSSSAEASGIVLSDGGNIVVERGFCWDTLASPTLNNASLQCGAGVGNFIGAISGLMGETTYYVRAYATNGEGTSYGAVFSFTTPQYTGGNGGGNGGSGGSGGEHTYVEWDGEGLNPNDSYPCEGTPTLTDIDGNVYNTVQIGNQCWMKENLRTTHYADNTEITTGIYAPNDYASSVTVYGYLYTWIVSMHGDSPSSSNPSSVQGICPDGWHMPSDAEWTQLIAYVGSHSAYFCGNDTTSIAKSLAHEMGWRPYNVQYPDVCAVAFSPWGGNNNSTGFGALPAGYRYQNQCEPLGLFASFWGTTESPFENYMNYYHINWNSLVMACDRFNMSSDACSVRCLKD